MQGVQKRAIAKAMPSGYRNFSAHRLLSTTQYYTPQKSLNVRRYRANPPDLLRRIPASPAQETLTRRSYFSTYVGNAFFNNEKLEQESSTGRMSSRVPILVDGNTVDFSAILLRVSCACSSCVHESTNQRLFSTADIPADIQARTIEIDAASDSVDIKWESDAPGYNGDHTTRLVMADLRELSHSGCPHSAHKESPPPQALWTQESLNLPDYDYNMYMQDDAIPFDVINQLRIHGLAFVTNVPGIKESLATIATRIGPVKDTFYGYTWDVRTVPEAINAAYTSHDLGFHTDLLYFEQPPHIQLLHCVQSASSENNLLATLYPLSVKKASFPSHSSQIK